jgi:hypothetical protein
MTKRRCKLCLHLGKDLEGKKHRSKEQCLGLPLKEARLLQAEKVKSDL